MDNHGVKESQRIAQAILGAIVGRGRAARGGLALAVAMVYSETPDDDLESFVASIRDIRRALIKEGFTTARKAGVPRG